ncbi:MAG TPA: hypothetical protein EYG50_09400 [Cycloclasticus sp.]|nr:hypothetical protein [Cycloclasticus sp.]
MSDLKRINLFAPDDLGLKKAVKLFLSLNDLSAPAEFDAIAKKPQLYHTVAIWNLWTNSRST